MLAFLPQRLALLCVPKTGTTALEDALRPRAGVVLSDHPSIKHLTLRQYHRLVKPLVDKAGAPRFETMALIREPLDWLGSWYRYRSRPAARHQPASTHGVRFADFVAAYLEAEDRPPYADLGRQSEFVAPKPGTAPLDHLFRYEAMGTAVAFLQDRLGGAPIALPRANVSPDGDLSLPRALRLRVETELAAEFETWARARH